MGEHWIFPLMCVLALAFIWQNLLVAAILIVLALSAILGAVGLVVLIQMTVEDYTKARR